MRAKGKLEGFSNPVSSVSARSEGWVGVGVVRDGAWGKEGHCTASCTWRPWHLKKREAWGAKGWAWGGECVCSVAVSLDAQWGLAGNRESRLSGMCGVSTVLFPSLHPISVSLAASSALTSPCPAGSCPLRIPFTCLTCLLLPCWSYAGHYARSNARWLSFILEKKSILNWN